MAFDANTGTIGLPEPEPESASVLVVSEDAALADAVSLLLEEWGFIALIAEDVSQAFDVCRSSKPNLVLLDLLTRAATIEAFADRVSREMIPPPLIAVHRDEEVVNSLRNASIEFLRAPFRLDDLQELVQQYCVPPGGWTH